MTKEDKSAIIIVLILIAFIILYAISAGRINIINKDEESEETKRERARKEHEAYLKKLNNDKRELAKIQRKRKIIFFLVRLLVVGTWFTVSIFFLATKVVPDLSTLVLYNEVLILIILALLFLFAGSLTSVKEMLEYLKNTVDNKLYQRRLRELNTNIQKSETGIKLIEKSYQEIAE